MRQKMDFSIAQVILGIRVFKIDLDSNANDKCIVHPEVSLHLVSPRKVREWSYLVNHSPNISFWSATLCSYNNPVTALSSISHREHLKVRLDEEGKRIATANVVDLGAGWNWPSILRRWGISPTRLCQSKSITNIHSFVTFWLTRLDWTTQEESTVKNPSSGTTVTTFYNVQIQRWSNEPEWLQHGGWAQRAWSATLSHHVDWIPTLPLNQHDELKNKPAESMHAVLPPKQRTSFAHLR